MQNQRNKEYLAKSLDENDFITHVQCGDAPVVNFTGDNIEKLSSHLSTVGWIQHAHPLPNSSQSYIRVALRKHISTQLLDQLLDDINDFYLAK
jgi:hypothetical protein